jgi:hypothetical protein
VCLLLNHRASSALGWKIPMQALTGQTPDIFKFLHFSLYEPVYYHSHSDTFPSASNEGQGGCVGVATHVGDELTYKIPTQKQRAIDRSAIHSAMDHTKQNQQLLHLEGRQYPITLTRNFLFDQRQIHLRLQ